MQEIKTQIDAEIEELPKWKLNHKKEISEIEKKIIWSNGERKLLN